MEATAKSTVQPPNRSLLSECREIANSRLAQVISGALAKIDEDLFQLADKSMKRDEQQMYLDAMTQVRQHRTDIQRKFEECFRAIYDKRMDGSKAEAKSTRPGAESALGDLELSLVSDSIIETGIAIDRLAKSVNSSVDNNELLGIRARLGMLLNRDSLEDADNPISPEAIFEALKLACNHIPAEDSVKQAMLSAFQPYLSKSITQIYHAVNQSLVAHHIMPRLRHTVKSNGGDPMGASQRMMGLSASQRMKTLSQSGRMGQFDGALGGDAWAGVPAGGDPWGTVGAGGDSYGIAALLAGLAQGQATARAESLRMLADPALFTASAPSVPASPPLLETLARLQTEANLGTAAGLLAPGYLRGLDRNLVAEGTPLDQLTVELVTVVFDYLSGNERIAPAVKGQIARLQIVAVKAAILDRSFFASRQHPMRRFLDRMGEAGCDPAMNLADNSGFLNGVTHIVDDLSVQFKDEVAIFETAFAELDRLIQCEHDARDAESRAQAEALAAQEVLAAADAEVRADLAGRVLPGTPAFIREFLTTWWHKAVVDSQVRSLTGEDSVAVRLNLAADLIWSVENKARSDIPALAGMLPRLVRGLMRGVIAQGILEVDRQAFFNQLMKAHTEAIAAAKVAVAEAPSLPVPSQSAEIPVLKAVPMVAASDAFERTVLELVKGDAVTFSDQKAADRFKLTWISPKRTFYLFTSSGGMRQLSASALAMMFRQGAAVLVEAEAPMIDRAIDALAAEPQPVALAA